MSVRRGERPFVPPRPIYSNISWQFTESQIKDEIRLHAPTDSFPKLFRLLADLAPKLVIEPAIEITDNVAYLAVKRNLSNKEFVIEVENLLAEVIDNSNYLSRFKITAHDSRVIAKQVAFIILNNQDAVLSRITSEEKIPTDAKSDQIKWNAWWKKNHRHYSGRLLGYRKDYAFLLSYYNPYEYKLYYYTPDDSE